MIKKIIGQVFILSLLWTLFPWEAQAQNIGYLQKRILGVPCSIVQVDLKSPKVHIRPALAEKYNGKLYPCESFYSMVRHYQPVAAINGNYFDVKTFRPVSTIKINGKTYYHALRGTAICMGENNRIKFIRLGKFTPKELNLAHYNNILCAGPTLLSNRYLNLEPRKEGFKDRRIFSSAIRSALGITRHNKMLLVHTHAPVTLKQLASIMKKLGSTDAVALDGGSSSALYAQGKFLAHPKRYLTNVLLVYESKTAISRAKAAKTKTTYSQTSGM